jgi:hypothetical protein
VSQIKKLNMSTLKRLIHEEKKKLKSKEMVSQEPEEDAWAGGDNLVNKIDFIKKLGIKESRLRKKAETLARARKIMKSRIIKDL